MPDPLVSLQQPLVDLGLRFSRLSRKFFDTIVAFG